MIAQLLDKMIDISFYLQNQSVCILFHQFSVFGKKLICFHGMGEIRMHGNDLFFFESRNTFSCHHPTVFDNSDPAAYAIYFSQIMRRHENRRSGLRHLGQQLIYFILQKRIKTQRRLIENQQLRLQHESQDNTELLLVSR